MQPHDLTITEEERELVEVFRRAKKERHAGLLIEIKDGEPVKVNWTHKEDLGKFRRLKENV